MDRTAILSGALTALACVIGGCGGERRLTVGSKNFTEQLIVGEILAQHLEARLGVPVDRKLNLGGTLLAHQALVSGEIDLYPEYSGTALLNVVKAPAEAGARAVEDRVRAAYRERWNIEWMAPLGFNNTFAMVVKPEDAIVTLSDAAKRAKPWKLGVGYEFETRPDGLAGLRKIYGLPLAGAPKAMDLGLLYAALEQDRVDMIAASATDGLIAARRLRVLTDDRGYFPPYHAAVAVRAPALDRWSGLRAALEELAGTMSDDTMRRLNYAVDGEHRAVEAVAAEWLASR
ncbi:MAG: glycine betaine ABC transporter substrate-binding protein [Bryobacteraceae bacterium]